MFIDIIIFALSLSEMLILSEINVDNFANRANQNLNNAILNKKNIFCFMYMVGKLFN